MKTIIKIVLAILVITICFNVGSAILGKSQFEDAVKQALLFDPRASDEEIVTAVMKIADEFEVPLDAKDITIHQAGSDVIVDMSYTQTVTLVPGLFSHDWTFTPSASTRILTGVRR